MNEEQEIKKDQITELCRKRPYFILAVCLLIAHLLLEVLYLAFGLRLMGAINAISIGIYAVMTFGYERIERSCHIHLIFWEVLLFSLIAVVLYGDDACYSINVIPLIPVLACGDYESKYVTKEASGHNRMQWALVWIVVVYIAEQLLDGLDFYLYRSVPAQHTTIICFFNFVTLLMGVLIATLMWWNLTDYTAGLLADSLQKADYYANHDPLTGLRNRKSMDALIRGLEQKNQEYGFIIADIDDFKKFNDVYGHDCGDEVLQRISSIIRRSVRTQDYIFRWGGEEIVIILTDIHRKLAERRAADICRKIAEEVFFYNGSQISMTVTMGVTVSQGRIAHEVMKEADRFLFQGKKQGKNCAIGVEGKIR